MPELSVASLSSVKVPPIIVKAAQNVPNLRRHPRMLPAVRRVGLPVSVHLRWTEVALEALGPGTRKPKQTPEQRRQSPPLPRKGRPPAQGHPFRPRPKVQGVRHAIHPYRGRGLSVQILAGEVRE